MGFGVSLKSAWGVDCFEETNAKIEKPLPIKVKDNRRAYELPPLSTTNDDEPKPTKSTMKLTTKPTIRDVESKKLFFVVGLGLLLIVFMDFMVKLGAILS
jgi:hypothetical protein